MISNKIMKVLLSMQQGEMTESIIYSKIAKRVKKEEDRKILLQIAEEEKEHAQIWSKYTNKILKVKNFKILYYRIISAVLGYTFALKLMEKGEINANTIYSELEKEIPEAHQIALDEARHEEQLLGLLQEERLKYVGSMVLGLNDALVELTGTIAGLTFALKDTRLVALSGLITGIAATLSMASSEYLSARSEGAKDALKSCIYTGIAYLITVGLLVTPYLIFSSENYLFALFSLLGIVLFIIFFFNYYIAVAKSENFKKRFIEMAAISLSVAFISFLIGLLVKQFLGIDI